MNRWQRAYMDQMGYKSVPRDKADKWAYQILGTIRETVTVDFPEFKGVNGVKPARTEMYVVDESELDMPNGKIDVITLVANLDLWIGRGYRVKTSGREQI